MADIFISYRRQDTQQIVAGMYNFAAEAFGPNAVFVDTASIAAGEDFLRTIAANLSISKVMLVIIGKNWLGLQPDGHSKIFSSGDLVRAEVRMGLARAREGNLTVLPVLVDDAHMPNAFELPSDIQDLTLYNAERVHSDLRYFKQDINRILDTLGAKGVPRVKEGVIEDAPDRFMVLAGVVSNSLVTITPTPAPPVAPRPAAPQVRVSLPARQAATNTSPLEWLGLGIALLGELGGFIVKAVLAIAVIVGIIVVVRNVTGVGLSEHSSCQDFQQASADAQNRVLQDMMNAHHDSVGSIQLTRASLNLYCAIYGPSAPIDGIYGSGSTQTQSNTPPPAPTATPTPVPTGPGTLLWSFRVNNSEDGSSELTVANGVVYVGTTGTTDVPAGVDALDASTGKLLWNAQLTHGAGYLPAVANARVYVDTYNGTVYALDAATGKQIWSFQAEFGASDVIAADGLVYVMSTPGTVFALDANTGKEVWVYPSRLTTENQQVEVGNGTVYVASNDGYVYALDAKTGTKRWNSPTEGYSVTSELAAANGVLYVGVEDWIVYALDANTGTRLWTYQTDSYIHGFALGNDVLYVGSGDSNLYALDAKTGAKRWSYATAGSVWTPVVVNGTVYVGATGSAGVSTGGLYAFESSTGALLWSDTTDKVIGNSVVADGVIYIACNDGQLCAFRA